MGMLALSALLNMSGVFQEYEFLDLSDVKEAELCSLQCALFERKSDTPAATASVGWAESALGKYSFNQYLINRWLCLCKLFYWPLFIFYPEKVTVIKIYHKSTDKIILLLFFFSFKAHLHI